VALSAVAAKLFCGQLPVTKFLQRVPMRSLPAAPPAFPNLQLSLLRIGVPVLLLAIAFSAFSVEPDVAAESPDWVQLFLGLFGGLALFLGGLQL
jgi:hypothetical protein